MKIAVIPDCQVKEGVDLSFLTWVGNYILDKRPDVLVQIGDFSDMESLSNYDQGKKSFEGRRIKIDVDITHKAVEMLLNPIWEFNQRARKNKEKQYRPRQVLTLGNHCDRINRATNDDPKLEGLISIDDLAYEKYGWEVVPFLQPVVIEGIAFSHYFPSGVLGRPITSAQMMVNKLHMSAVCGHQQGRQVAYGKRADGKPITCIMAGSCYLHDEGYLNPQTNNHWRGVVMLNEVKDGSFDEMFVSLQYLKEKYS